MAPKNQKPAVAGGIVRLSRPLAAPHFVGGLYLGSSDTPGLSEALASDVTRRPRDFAYDGYGDDAIISDSRRVTLTATLDQAVKSQTRSKMRRASE